MQEIRSLNAPVVTGICDPNKPVAQHLRSLILVAYLFVLNNSCDNSSFSMFFLFNLNIVPVLFLAADFNLHNCVFS